MENKLNNLDGLVELLLFHHYVLQKILQDLFLESGHSMEEFKEQLRKASKDVSTDMDYYKKRLYEARDFTVMMIKNNIDIDTKGGQSNGKDKNEEV